MNYQQQIETARQKWQQAENSLFMGGDRARPLFSQQEAARQRKEAKQAYQATIAGIQEEARRELESLQEQSPVWPGDTRWLSDEELTRASRAAVFVREDIADMEPAELVERLAQVNATGSLVERWLHYRYASHRFNEIDATDQPDRAAVRGVFLLKNTLKEMEPALLPADVREAQEKAQERRTAAESALLDAQMADPAHLQELAVNLGVSPQYMPGIAPA